MEIISLVDEGKRLEKEQPLVSVVIPCYNHAKFVQECIKSVIDQSYKNIELIIIDDGSKDESEEKIKEILFECEKRFVHFEFRCRPNKGLSKTLNESLKWCRGKYFFILASDDIIYSKIISKQVGLLEERKDLGMCHAHAESNLLKPNPKKKAAKKSALDFKSLLLRNEIYAPTAMIRMSVVRELGGFDESLYMEDWDFWLRLADKGYKIGFINEVLAFYREHDNNSYKNHDRMEEASDQILRKWVNHPFYEEAIKNERLRRFSFYAEVKKTRAIKYFLLTLCEFRKRCFYIALLKLFTPRIAFPLIRKFKK